VTDLSKTIVLTTSIRVQFDITAIAEATQRLLLDTDVEDAEPSDLAIDLIAEAVFDNEAELVYQLRDYIHNQLDAEVACLIEDKQEGRI
jgi:hypothetical protein